MARQEDEALDRLLTRTLQSQRAETGDVCPSAEDVAAYLERTLSSLPRASLAPMEHAR